jgi:hypothetical protein
MRVVIDLPENVFDALVKEKGSVKEVVERIVIEAVKGNGWFKAKHEAEKEVLKKKIRELQKENEELREKLQKLEAQNHIDLDFVDTIVRNSVREALCDLLEEHKTESFQAQKTFVEKCREVIVAVNNYLDSIDEPVRLKLSVQDNGLIVCEPKIIANFLDYYAIHPEKLKSLAKLIEEIDPEIKVQVIEPEGVCKGYILLKSNANELHEVENAHI